MPGKVTIDINLRTARKATLLWNRLTPTRGAKAVCRSLADKCSSQAIKFSPKNPLLKHYAGGLKAAGVTGIVIEKGTTAGEIRKMLNVLTGRGFGATARLLPRYGFTPESPNSVLNWADLHSELATVNYRDVTYFNGGAAIVAGFIGFWLGVSILTELEPKALRLGGALLGAAFPTLFKLFYHPLKHAYRAARFYEDCKLLDHMSRGGESSNFSHLWNIIFRMGPENRIAATLNWDFSALGWLPAGYNDLVINNPRVRQAIKIAHFSSDAERLTALAANPIPAVRAEAAKNSSLPEPVLAKLINDDPDRSVREAVRENPVVDSYIRLAKNSFDPEELANLAGKPFPCVRRAAARNPRTPWNAVAWVLSQLYKDPIEGVVDTQYDNMAGPCDPPNYQKTEFYGTVGHGYVGKSLEISREILDIHDADRKSIMERLKELNPELHDALVKI